MKKKIMAILAVMLIISTCLSSVANAAPYSDKWELDSLQKWKFVRNGAPVVNAWVLDDECDVEGGLWYLLDENGHVVADPLVKDGGGNYYSFNGEHDGHYGALRTRPGTYHGVELEISDGTDGVLGSIKNKEAVEELEQTCEVREVKNVLPTTVVKSSQVVKYDSDDEETPVFYEVVFNLGLDIVGGQACTPSEIEPQYIEEGKRARDPEIAGGFTLHSEGYTFEGWYTDTDYLDLWDFKTDIIIENTVLYGLWSVAAVPVDSITLDKDSLTLTVEDEYALQAVVAPEDATYKELTWSSSDSSVATVDDSGLVTAVAKGTANIMAASADEKVTAVCEVTVEEVTVNFKYFYPIYNTDGDAATGIKEWKTGEKTEGYTIIDKDNLPDTLNSGWYFVQGTAQKDSEITIAGDVHLVLMDGCDLTVTGTDGHAAISITGADHTLTIYGQTKGNGKLTASGGSNGAGIGGSNGFSKYITINGGNITATGGSCGAGIGGAGTGFVGADLTFNGGTVTATGGSGAAGIGGGYKKGAFNLYFNGGIIEANGSAEGGAGIGSGSGNGFVVGQQMKFNGGEITAKCGAAGGSAIGNGLYATNCSANSIYFSTNLVVMADNVDGTTTLTNTGSDLATALKNKQFATITAKNDK